jgi:putative membrane protein
MSETHELKDTTRGRSLAKGLLAGLIGGLVATAAKTLAEKMYPPRTHGESEPREVLAEEAYGALVEYYPAATAKGGATFGMALTSLTHGTVLPAMGLSAKPEEQTARERTSEMATHVVYGVVTETVRRVVRKMLG